MSLTLRRAGILTAALAMLAAFLVAVSVPADASAGHVRTYRVTVENLTETQTLTPTVVATHNRHAGIYRVGRQASHGLQQLAENGGVDVLAAELESRRGVADVAVAGGAPIAPGESVEALITAGTGAWRLSAAGMLICTNDGFGGAKLRLPGQFGDQRVAYGRAYDAGTELNTERYRDLVPPCDGLGQSGESNPYLAQNGVVRPHRGIKGHHDLTVEDHGWEGPVVKITVERVRVFEVSIENLTDGQLQTPFVFATHQRGAEVFRYGAPASHGLQQLAENGGAGILAEELAARDGFGTVAVLGDAPVAPGESLTVQVVSADRMRYASLAAMLICTNDGFAGVDSARLPWRGDTAKAYGKAYDAGTEKNTESYHDLVPPCDGLGQTGETNPDLYEGGVVHRHQGIMGIADLDPAVHGWKGPVAKVKIERVG